jgi:tail protein P2 I
MTRPTVPDLTEQLYEELAVTQPADESLGWPFLILLAGIAAAMGELPELMRDTDDGPGWSAVLDPTRAPGWSLPWLAQFAGVRLTPGIAEADQRAEITAPPAFQRGTPAAMVATAARYLTGTKAVVFRERDGSPYRVSVSTRTAETPDPAVVEAAVRKQKPAGLILTYTVADGPTWPEPTSTWATATGTWADAMTTIP